MADRLKGKNRELRNEPMSYIHLCSLTEAAYHIDVGVYAWVCKGLHKQTYT